MVDYFQSFMIGALCLAVFRLYRRTKRDTNNHG